MRGGIRGRMQALRSGQSGGDGEGVGEDEGESRESRGLGVRGVVRVRERESLDRGEQVEDGRDGEQQVRLRRDLGHTR